MLLLYISRNYSVLCVCMRLCVFIIIRIIIAMTVNNTDCTSCASTDNYHCCCYYAYYHYCDCDNYHYYYGHCNRYYHFYY